ncbi:MAG: hypothetical protein J5582_12995 [Ruminococcus sp.]|uniref:Lipoprotein n=1 Tax=Ruminococcus albus TaxID=1264 RepID=A0A1H7NFB3_RUMAL|nr:MULTISPECIES: hypothetical protein [Ruminococcus]MBO4867455.1 hypothetical protein [Ruminococcus sp.]SEL22266.1 hypothetical protein SAMN05216469_11522 [Ruminococcus albus]
MRRTALAAVIVSMTMLCGCMGKSISAVDYDKFSKTLLEEGYCAEDSISTTDTEDGTSSVVLTDNGWLAGFYECADEEIAENEFYNECDAAGIDDVRTLGRNGLSAEKDTDEGHVLYIKVGKTLLMMMGPDDTLVEMKNFAKKLGYSDK